MIVERIKELESSDRQFRIRCAEELGDLLEYGTAPVSELEIVAGSLINAICREADSESREVLTNTLAILASRNIGLKAPWERLAAVLPQLDKGSLENALCAIGFSRDRNLAKFLGEYQRHSDEAVRGVAGNALLELNVTKQ